MIISENKCISLSIPGIYETKPPPDRLWPLKHPRPYKSQTKYIRPPQIVKNWPALGISCGQECAEKPHPGIPVHRKFPKQAILHDLWRTRTADTGSLVLLRFGTFAPSEKIIWHLGESFARNTSSREHVSTTQNIPASLCGTPTQLAAPPTLCVSPPQNEYRLATDLRLHSIARYHHLSCLCAHITRRPASAQCSYSGCHRRLHRELV